MNKYDKIILRLIDIAVEERRILTTGRLEDLQVLESAKSSLIERLQNAEFAASTAPMRRLRRLSEENQQLYLAAIEGVRRVSKQVASLISGAEFKTYESNGGRTNLSGRGSRWEKRA